MANFDTGNLLTAQTIINKKYATPEMRMKPSPAFALLLRNTGFIGEDVTTLKTRDDRPFEVHLLSRTKRTSGSSRAYNHTGTLDDSMKVTPTWTTKSDKTAISLKLLDKSVHDFNTVLANKLEQCMMNIIEDEETAAIAYLAAQKTQYSATLQSGTGTFNTTNDTFEIAAENKLKFYQHLKSIFRQNKHTTQLDVIADPLMYIESQHLAAQGAGNNTNTNYQFDPSLNIVESIELADNNYTNGLVIAMPKDSVGALTWIPKQNRQGWGDYNSYVGGYGTMRDPWGLGLLFAVHGYASRTDTSATNGDTQDVTMEFEVSLDVSFNKAPLSGSNSETIIYQAGLIS